MTGHATYDLFQPRAWDLPLVISAPHSGAELPFAVTNSARKAAMDALNDTAIHALALPAAASLGFPVLSSRYGRAFIDLNRDVGALDPLLIEGLERPVQADSRVAMGLGLIPRLGSGGVPLHTHKISLAAVQSRIERAYQPYHRCLSGLIDGCLARFGTCLLLDLHSMPPVLPAVAQRAMHATPGQPTLKSRRFSGPPLNLVLGDCYGASLPSHLADHSLAFFQQAGLTAAHNRPYAGGFITEHYGQRVPAFQLEFCRSLYPGDQGKALERLFYNYCQSLPFPQPMAEAAE